MADKSQLKIVANHLTEKRSITSWEAINRYNITRLAAYVWILRHKHGWKITSENRTVINSYGNATTIAVYKLEGDYAES